MCQRVHHAYAGFFVLAVTVHHKEWRETEKTIPPAWELAHDWAALRHVASFQCGVRREQLHASLRLRSPSHRALPASSLVNRSALRAWIPRVHHVRSFSLPLQFSRITPSFFLPLLSIFPSSFSVALSLSPKLNLSLFVLEADTLSCSVAASRDRKTFPVLAFLGSIYKNLYTNPPSFRYTDFPQKLENFPPDSSCSSFVRSFLFRLCMRLPTIAPFAIYTRMERTRDLFRGTSCSTIIVTVIVGHSIGTDFYVTAGTFDLSVSACWYLSNCLREIAQLAVTKRERGYDRW